MSTIAKPAAKASPKAASPKAAEPKAAEPNEVAKAPEVAKGTKLVRMKRDEYGYPSPHVADVHPEEVENYRLGGWS